MVYTEWKKSIQKSHTQPDTSADGLNIISGLFVSRSFVRLNDSTLIIYFITDLFGRSSDTTLTLARNQSVNRHDEHVDRRVEATVLRRALCPDMSGPESAATIGRSVCANAFFCYVCLSRIAQKSVRWQFGRRCCRRSSMSRLSYEIVLYAREKRDGGSERARERRCR